MAVIAFGVVNTIASDKPRFEGTFGESARNFNGVGLIFTDVVIISQMLNKSCSKRRTNPT